MTYDRNYLRMLSDSALRIYATENITTDLEVVLLERLRDLQDADAHLEAAQVEIEDLTKDRDYWESEASENLDALEAAQETIDCLEAEIAILKAK